MAILFHSDLDDPTEWRKAFKHFAPDMPFYVWPDQSNSLEVDIAVVWKPTSRIWKSCPNIKLIASLGAGVDHLFRFHTLPKGVPVTRIVDKTLTEQMVEYVVMATLFCHRNMPTYIAQQRSKKWRPVPQPLGRDCSIGMRGLGVLGSSGARALHHLNFDIKGWSRSPKDIKGIKTYVGNEELNNFLIGNDILISLLPLTPETENIVDKNLLSCLLQGAQFINAGRGAHVVEPDLIKALDEGIISHAFLDVTREEPLPKNNRLWSHPNVTLTPHVASITDAFSSSKQIIENFERLEAGLELLNIVDPQVGY